MAAQGVGDYVGLSLQLLEGEGESRHGFDPPDLAIVERWVMGALRQFSLEDLVVGAKFEGLAVEQTNAIPSLQ